MLQVQPMFHFITNPATQAHNHDILPDSHFLFFCWFLLSHSISLGLDHRYFTALSLISPGCLSSPPSFFCTDSHLGSLCFSVVFCTSTQSACCMQKDFTSTFVVLKFGGILPVIFKYCTMSAVPNVVCFTFEGFEWRFESLSSYLMTLSP